MLNANAFTLKSNDLSTIADNVSRKTGLEIGLNWRDVNATVIDHVSGWCKDERGKWVEKAIIMIVEKRDGLRRWKDAKSVSLIWI
jgi:hypothetical protein